MTFRCYLSALIVFSLMNMAVPGAHGDASTDARRAIEAVYNKRVAAYKHKDAAALLSTFATDYEAVGKEGRKLTFPMLRQLVSEAFAANANYNYQYDIQKFSLKGKQADLTVKERTETRGVFKQTGAPFKTTVDSLLQVVWEKGTNGWLEKSVKTLKMRRVQEE